MTPKKKDSPELFEVFRSAVRDREAGADDPEAVSSAERESLVAQEAEAPEPPRRLAVPPAEPDPPSGMGERRVALRYNSVVLGLMATVGLVFVAFAMGVRWGEDRTTKRAAAGTAGERTSAQTEEDARLAEQLGPLAAPPAQPETPANAQAAADPGLPSESVIRPPAPTRTDAQTPAGKWWVRLIDFDVNDASAEALVATHLRKLAEKGFGQVRVWPRVRSGKNVTAVCRGPFQTKTQATEELRKTKASNPNAYKYADLIFDE